MSAPELELWWHCYCQEPWGDYRADLRMGILAATMANMWMEKGHRRLTPTDFLPQFGRPAPRPVVPPPPRQSSQDMFAILLQGTLAAGGTVDARLGAGV
jgi:hypothetical protein